VIVKSKHTSCYGCKYHKSGYCYWFKPNSKIIPRNIISIGCKYRVAVCKEVNTTKIVGYIVDKFDGELV
jgi:hypothetical protein